MVSVLLKVEQNGPEVEAQEAVLGAASVLKFLYLTAEGREFKQPTVLPGQTQMSEHAGDSHHVIPENWLQLRDITSMEFTVHLPDAGEFLEENGELLQGWKVQMRIFKEPGGRLEKVLAAAGV